jgi:hypothetical protein
MTEVFQDGIQPGTDVASTRGTVEAEGSPRAVPARTGDQPARGTNLGAIIGLRGLQLSVPPVGSHGKQRRRRSESGLKSLGSLTVCISIQ